MELLERLSEPTPKFFKKVLRFSLLLGAIGTAIATAPISLPAGLVSVGSYLATIGATGVVVSKTASTMR
jgi:hypothetical protein